MGYYKMIFKKILIIVIVICGILIHIAKKHRQDSVYENKSQQKNLAERKRNFSDVDEKEIKIDDLENDLPVYNLKVNSFYRDQLKRILDITICIPALVVSVIPMGFLAIAIKLESPGPVLFRQKRLGMHGEEFELLKFRSMVVGAEKMGTGVYCNAGDPRVTHVGRFARATSLDELPQLINILKGDMSLIGPRPPLTYHPWPIDEYTEEQKRMFNVRPGITGWAQIHGRKAVEWHRRIELNVYEKIPANYNIADMHYNEVTWGSWGGLNISEMKYDFDITFAYNNRKFFDLMFRVPIEKRISDQHHLDMKKALNKELFDMNIRVVNVKETKFRAFALNVIFTINSILPF